MLKNSFRFPMGICCFAILFIFSISIAAQVRTPKRGHTVSQKKDDNQRTENRRSSRSEQSAAVSTQGSTHSVPPRQRQPDNRRTAYEESVSSENNDIRRDSYIVQRDKDRSQLISQTHAESNESQSFRTVIEHRPVKSDFHHHESHPGWHDPFFILDMTVETLFQVKLSFPDSACLYVTPRTGSTLLPSGSARLSSLYMNGKPAAAKVSFHLPYSNRNALFFQSSQAYSGLEEDNMQCGMIELGAGRILASNPFSRAELILGYHMGMEEWGTFALLRGVSMHRPFVCEGELKTSPMTRHFKLQGGLLWDVFEVYVAYCYEWQDEDFQDGLETGLRIWM